MAAKEPTAERNLDGYGAPPIPWTRVRERLEQGFTQAPGTGGPGRHTCWLATVRPDGRPHVMPLGVLWVDGACYFNAGPSTRKARNLQHNPQCVISVATDAFDLVIEGEAILVALPWLGSVGSAADRRDESRGAAVAIGVLFQFPGVTSEQYDEVCRKLNNGWPLASLSDWPDEGIVAHVAGPTADGGWRVVDVWESEEAFQRFGQRLLPLLEQAGFPAEAPQVFPVHNLVTQ